MNLTFGLCLLLIVSCNCANVKRSKKSEHYNNYVVKRSERSPETRVYGGSQALESKYKFVIFSLYVSDQYLSLQKCSGVLIKSDWVLFPAHCFGSCPSPRNISLILVGGKTDLSEYFLERERQLFDFDIDERYFGVQERRAKYLYVHRLYYFKTSEYDVALVRSTKPFEIGTMLQVVPISKSKIKSNPSCMIVGYKSETTGDEDYWENYITTTKIEMYADDVVVLEKCRPKKEDFICIEGGKYRYTCRENFALICDGQVWAIATQSDSTSSCFETEQDKLTELYPYVEWIEQTIAEADGKSIVEIQKSSGTMLDFLIIGLASGLCFFLFWLLVFMFLSKNRKWCFAPSVVEPAYSPLLAAYPSDEDDDDVVMDKTNAAPVEDSL